MARNSDRFNLEDWKLTLPVNKWGIKAGKALEIKDLEDYEHPRYFYDSYDGAMVFKAATDGATTHKSSYARSELREMDNGKLAAWDLDTGGILSATLKVEQVPLKNDGSQGRVVVGQVLGESDELVRLCYENNSLYFVNDKAGGNRNREARFTFENKEGEKPNVSLGEKFSYMIQVREDTLKVKIFADGQEYVSHSSIHSAWQKDDFFFKAGVYLGLNENSGEGIGKAAFYGVSFGHQGSKGSEAWKKHVARDIEKDDDKDKENPHKSSKENDKDHSPKKATVEKEENNDSLTSPKGDHHQSQKQTVFASDKKEELSVKKEILGNNDDAFTFETSKDKKIESNDTENDLSMIHHVNNVSENFLERFELSKYFSPEDSSAGKDAFTYTPVEDIAFAG